MKRIKETSLDVLFFIIGSCLYSISVNVFTSPNNIAPGGVTGIGTMLHYAFGTPIGIVGIILNIPIIIAAIIQIGYKLVIKTSLAIVCTSAAIDLLGMVLPEYHGDMIIVVICGGVFEGIGLSLIFARGATTGGTDMLARILGNKVKFLSMGKLMLCIDGLVILASAFVYKSVDSAVYAIIDVFVSTKIIDYILYGIDIGNGKLFYVISPKAEEISQRIMDEMERGVTLIKSRGAYTKVDGEMLMCAVRRFEITKLNKIIRSIDKDAFVIVSDAGEITGEGFKSISSDDKTLSQIVNDIKTRNSKEK